jgi:hypothetical protein
MRQSFEGQATEPQDTRGAHGVTLAAPEREGPMLQAPQKQRELEMSPGERELYVRAVHLVQNKAGLSDDEAVEGPERAAGDREGRPARPRAAGAPVPRCRA